MTVEELQAQIHELRTLLRVATDRWQEADWLATTTKGTLRDHRPADIMYSVIRQLLDESEPFSVSQSAYDRILELNENPPPPSRELIELFKKKKKKDV